jgi:hypothetical protein
MRRSEVTAARIAALLRCAAVAMVAMTLSAHAATPAPNLPTASAPCLWDARFVSARVKPQPASAFKGVDRQMKLPEIVAKLGPAQRDVGSGLHVLQWPVADGRWFSVSVPDTCSEPMAAGFLRAVKPPRPRPGTPPSR